MGIKAEIIPDRLVTSLAFFDLTRTNFAAPDPQNAGFQTQIGEQNSQGIEFDIIGEITPGWNISAYYSYIDAKITEDRRDAFVDNTLVNVPRNSFGIWTTYTFQEGALEGFGFGGGIFYEDLRQGDLDNSFDLPSYIRTDATIFYKKDNLNVSLNFNNLFDERYFEGSRSDVRVIPGAPFSFVGRVSWEF